MEINHPKHYNQYPVEVIDMMINIWGKEATRTFCILNAFKYRMRVGHKDDIKSDLAKEQWYLDKAEELNLSFQERMDIALGANSSPIRCSFPPSTVPGDFQTISNNETDL